jgi:hypothetical protein
MCTAAMEIKLHTFLNPDLYQGTLEHHGYLFCQLKFLDIHWKGNQLGSTFMFNMANLNAFTGS